MALFRWVLTLLLTLHLLSCQRVNNDEPALPADEEPMFQDTFQAFGTIVSINIVGLDEKNAQDYTAAIMADLIRLYGFWHPREPGPLARINSLLPTGGHFYMSPSSLPLFENSIPQNTRSGRLFDPGLGTLIELWGFHDMSKPPTAPPRQQAIDEVLRRRPSLGDVELNGLEIWSKNKAVLLDFGAIAEGVALEMEVNRLKSFGIKNALLNVGGDLRAIGQRGKRAWRVGIKNPRGNDMIAVVETHGDESVFTSGDYERFFMYKGTRYHHILDPRTGYPARGSISVTVIHEHAPTADAGSTALFIAGPERWRQTAENMGIKYVMLIAEDQTIYMTKEFASRVKLKKSAAGKKIIIADETHESR